MRMYEREVNFYTRLAGHSHVRVPHCYFADFDPDTCQSTILMEFPNCISRSASSLDFIGFISLPEGKTSQFLSWSIPVTATFTLSATTATRTWCCWRCSLASTPCR